MQRRAIGRRAGAVSDSAANRYVPLRQKQPTQRSLLEHVTERLAPLVAVDRVAVDRVEPFQCRRSLSLSLPRGPPSDPLLRCERSRFNCENETLDIDSAMPKNGIVEKQTTNPRVLTLRNVSEIRVPRACPNNQWSTGGIDSR